VKTTVIICTYTDERRAMLDATIAAVQAQDPPCDELLLVIDHNPALAADLRTSAPDAVVVENEERRGLSGARNTGIRAASGDVLVFLDDDAVPRPGWLRTLLAPLDDPTVAGVGGSAEPAWETGARPAWMPEELDWVVGCSFRGQAGGDVRNPIGCSMALRASVFERVGGFVAELGRVGKIPLGCEETELGLRVNRDGGRIVLARDSVVDHFVPRQRATVRYVLHRCYAEGISKSVVRRLAAAHAADGTGARALGPERRYVVDLGRAVLRAPVEATRRRSAGALGAVLVVPAALAAAAIGFARGELARR
jgi:glycosyltransferase involved in cell wall biosynthesis